MLDPSARSQYRAMISARIGHAVAKASIMRLLGVPRFPLPLVSIYPRLFPVLPLLETALARQIPFPLLSASPTPPL